MFAWLRNFFSRLFGGKDQIALGIYGPPNTGKTTLANVISEEFTGEKLGNVSEIPHETREVKRKEKVTLETDGYKITMNLLDMPGISTKVDFEEFMDYGMGEEEAKVRSKEATRGVVEAINWLDNVDVVIVVLDSTRKPYNQVNVTILGNLEAKDIPIILVANKIDLAEANPEAIRETFPQYSFAKISAKEEENINELYSEIIESTK
ncbi:GTP-binding protein [candidate division MSBL1 archaeon SCGC-AAA259I09]|uniref:GTP-binding protein n=3 Tax=candidate division MSBL1 TaxID=215777 RepID=A0A133USV1_9EURY|nr:GTP-binding protein [candidate division MSBL1 archaeon SCGC-AAA259I09]KXA98259.1 GTP-binding protein [candidate division MSBL1 archaeon SCGC-AAA259J03]